MLHELVESGGLAGQPGDYQLTTPLDHLVVPSNVRAVLAARIDRLPDPAKRLLHTAAVIGKEFSGPLLDAVHDLARLPTMRRHSNVSRPERWSTSRRRCWLITAKRRTNSSAPRAGTNVRPNGPG